MQIALCHPWIKCKLLCATHIQKRREEERRGQRRREERQWAMKVIRQWSGYWRGRRSFIPKISTETLTSLEKRILLIKDHKVSIIPILNEWIVEGGEVDKYTLRELAKRMQQYKRYHHAFEVSRWIGDHGSFLFSPEDIAVRLDLIYMVHGLKHAEKYFNYIPLMWKKTSAPYCALLYCYVKEKSLEKAETLVEKMKKLGLATTAYFYKLLITLYSQTGQHEKIDILIQEMESNEIPHEQSAMVNRLTEYVAVSDVGGMEKVLDQMEKGPGIYVDWTVYAIMADGYLKARLIDKALEMMKTVEKKINMTIIPDRLDSSLCLEYLLTLYTRVGKREELYRIWNLRKSSGRLQNTSYSTMITSLSEFDDMDGAKKIFEEWESTDPRVDSRVLNRLVAVYGKKGLLEKAESVVERVVKKAAKSEKAPYASTWNILATGYLKEKRMPKAVEMFKKAMLVARGDWKLKPSSVDSCLEYFEEQGDVEEAEEFIKLLRKSGPLTREIYHMLLRTYIAAHCKKGLLEKAESVVERVVKKAAKSEKAPYANTWNVLATGYLGEKRMPKAVEMFKKAMLVAREDWKLKPSSVDSCLEYFEEQGDVEEAEEFIKLLRKSGPLTREVYHRLLRTYIVAQKPVSGVLNRLKVDGFCVDETTTNILERQPDLL